MSVEKELFGDTSVRTFIETIVDQTFERIRSSRECPVLSDRDFVLINLTRVIQEQRSGRDFLQKQEETSDLSCDLHTYFEALHSERRLSMLQEFAAAFQVMAQRVAVAEGVDYLSDFPELNDRQVIAADGHYHEHACHADRTPDGKLIPVGSIYQLDMHTGILAPMTIIQTDAKKHHEIKPLRKFLRTLNSGAGRKPIVVYDPAIMDKQFFSEMKRMRQGVEIITRMKKNVKPTFREPQPFDRSLPINTGVVNDYCIGLDNAGTMRLIHYINPEDHQEYWFLTTLEELQPGLIAWLYLKRWDIEKVFDVKKNKLYELKAWGTGPVAQQIQDLFLSIAMNLLRLIMQLFEAKFQIAEKKLVEKRQAWLKQREERAKRNNGYLHPLVRSGRHMYQLSIQFIRTIRNHLFNPKTIRQLLPVFRERMTVYLGAET